jgi:hypothetical protein
MANSTRTKWMAQCISDIFNINEYESLVSKHVYNIEKR